MIIINSFCQVVKIIQRCLSILGLSLQTHVDLALNPIFSMWNVYLLSIIVDKATQISELVYIIDQIIQIVGNLLGIFVAVL